MCWYTQKIPELKIASEDISVFKILSVDVNTGKIKSPIWNSFTWEPYVVRESIMDTPYKIGEMPPVYVIDQGLHCFRVAPYLGSKKTYLDEEEAVDYWYLTSSRSIFHANPRERVFKCVIPKGAEYYINEDDGIVTNRLMILEEF